MRKALMLTPQEADAVADALSYYEMVCTDNFGGGYHGEEGREERKAHKRVSRVLKRVTKLREEED